MKLFHLIGVNHNPPEIREEYPTIAEYERTYAEMSRRYQTVFLLRTFDGFPSVRSNA